jgi:hypothetical protein
MHLRNPEEVSDGAKRRHPGYSLLAADDSLIHQGQIGIF